MFYGKAALDCWWKCGRVAGKPRRGPHTRERDVRVVGSRVQCEAADGHPGGYSRLQSEQFWIGFDVGEEDACPGKRSEDGQSKEEALGLEAIQRMDDAGEAVFGDLAEEDQREVDIFRRDPAGLRKVDALREVGEGLGEAFRDRQADKEAHTD